MKKYLFFTLALCVYMLASAQNKKVETFDKNLWKWTEGTDKYQSVVIEDGYLVISNYQNYKKATPYQNLAKSYARLPLRPNDNFKLTIKYIVADYNLTSYSIYFNTEKNCLMDEEETNQFKTYQLHFNGPTWMLFLADSDEEQSPENTQVTVKDILGAILNIRTSAANTLPGKVKSKGEYPMELVLEKKSKNLSIEVNGIQIYDDECQITNPCMGFSVPLFNKKFSYIKIDEIIVEQADNNDD